MIPILYGAGTTEFSTNGLGGLPDAISGTVTEEKNGIFELEMQYPIDGLHFDELSVDRIIKAKPNQTADAQAFRIYNISKPIDGKVTVNAEHISYQLQHIPLLPFSATTVTELFTKISTYSATSNPFTFNADVAETIDYTLATPKSCRAVLLGDEGILDMADGEFEFDNFTVNYWLNRGQDNGVKICYGKNLKDLKQEENIEDTITAVCPYWSKDDTVVTLDDKIVSLSDSAFAYTRAVPLDLSSSFDAEPTQDELKSAAEEYLKTAQTTPKVNITVDFVMLGDTLDYPEFKGLETVSLCDTITVEFDKLGVNTTAKVIKTEYDFIAEKYNKIEIGDVKDRLADTVVKAAGVDKQQTNSLIEQIVQSQTSLITGAKDSYVVVDMDDNDGKGQRILFMDSPDVAQAKQVLQINKNGIGFSQNGVDGDYTDAWTIDGNFNTDFINAQLLRGVSINVTGGEINIESDSDSKSVIKLNRNDNSLSMHPYEITLQDSRGYTTYMRASYFMIGDPDGNAAFSVLPNGKTVNAPELFITAKDFWIQKSDGTTVSVKDTLGITD